MRHLLVLLRHGESQWNKDNRFTGWTDVGLTKRGEQEAREAARLLKQQGFVFDIAFCNVLKRAIRTLEIVMEELGQNFPVKYSWRLNERHYGALQGLNKAEMASRVGEKQVFLWRRSFDIRPPALTKEDPRWPGNDSKYKGVPKDLLPLTESLKDTIARVLPYWENEIAPALQAGKRVLISASGNSLRALVKHLDNVPDDEIPKLNIPTGIPLVYELDRELKPVRHYYLGDPNRVKAAMQRVAEQGKTQQAG